MDRPRIIAVDFDGCLCEENWPNIGEPILENIEYIKACKEAGDKIILWTCRAGKDLQVALKWCKEQGIIFDYINKNAQEAFDMFGHLEESRKIFADVYLDDKCVNIGRKNEI